MEKNLRKALLAVFMTWSTVSQLQAQAVIFPQIEQPGTAVATSTDGSYQLSNSLFTATFTKADGVLLFGGSDELHLNSGTELFKITLGDGTVVPASGMTLGEVTVEPLTGVDSAVKGSHRFNGQQIVADFTYGNLSLEWRAVLRDGSHYLRTELDITSSADQTMTNIIPMLYTMNTTTGGIPAVVGNTRGAVLASDKLFAGLETPMGINSVRNGSFTGYNAWTTGSFSDIYDGEVPEGIVGLKTVKKKYEYFGGYGAYGDAISASNVVAYQGKLQFNETGDYVITFQYTSGDHRLNMVGVDLLGDNGNVVACDYHSGITGDDTYANTYTVSVTSPGIYTVRYFVETLTEVVGSSGTISYSKSVSVPVVSTVNIQGLWSRATTLAAGKTWNVSAVVGLIAEDQARRSFLAYSERERAVPWRPFPLYNSWYELNIDRNNASDPANNMQTSAAVDVLNQWKSNLFDAQGVGVKSFVWDDGWDNYQTWECHENFDFTEPSTIAKGMGAGTGVWLSPVGGYGVSGEARRNYWSSLGGMELSNPDYYEVFKNAASRFITEYNGNFFKFDGISEQASAVGPDTDETGEEDAEGIISMERDMRALEADVFLNTTVGTWASPFWYHFTDATWRQETDYGEIGNGSTDREKWITFRDRLVYQNYVQNSPLCPINTLMTHGFILTANGDVSTDMGYEGVLRELRCAFACGSGMVELYCDYSLMNSINNGALWADLAECITWQEKNKDVLPDIHWVGGSPWDGSTENVYGWASWNGAKATIALRNGSTSTKTYTTTLREILEIPAYITDANITLSKAFSHTQEDLSGLNTGEAIHIDTELTLTLSASSVYVFDGVQSDVETEEPGTETPDPVTVTREVNIPAGDLFGTCILPFNASLPNGLKAYECSTVENSVLTLTQVYNLVANTPYILYSSNGINTTFTGTVLDETVNEVSKGLLTGYALEGQEVSFSSTQYVMQNQGEGTMFYNAGGMTFAIPAGKCYLTVPDVSTRALRLSFGPTGLELVEYDDDKSDADNQIFDLFGRPVKDMIPGNIYIIEGRKRLYISE